MNVGQCKAHVLYIYTIPGAYEPPEGWRKSVWLHNRCFKQRLFAKNCPAVAYIALGHSKLNSCLLGYLFKR